jgi:hypothetical protein
MGGPVGAGPEDGFEIGAEIDLKPGGPVATGAETGPGPGKEEAPDWNPFAVMLCFTSQCVSWANRFVLFTEN